MVDHAAIPATMLPMRRVCTPSREMRLSCEQCLLPERKSVSAVGVWLKEEEPPVGVVTSVAPRPRPQGQMREEVLSKSGWGLPQPQFEFASGGRWREQREGDECPKHFASVVDAL